MTRNEPNPKETIQLIEQLTKLKLLSDADFRHSRHWGKQRRREGRMLCRTHQNGPRTGSKGARPGDYALGSPQSRAAARAMIRSAARYRGRGDSVTA